MLQNECLLADIGFDTAENAPTEIWQTLARFLANTAPLEERGHISESPRFIRARAQVEKLDSLMAPDAAAAPTGAFTSSNDGPAEALLEANATLAEGASATDQRKAGGHFRQAV